MAVATASPIVCPIQTEDSCPCGIEIRSGISDRGCLASPTSLAINSFPTRSRGSAGASSGSGNLSTLFSETSRLAANPSRASLGRYFNSPSTRAQILYALHPWSYSVYATYSRREALTLLDMFIAVTFDPQLRNKEKDR